MGTHFYLDKYFSHSSDRLRFRKLTHEDAEEWAHFFHDNDSLKYFHFEFKGPVETYASQWVQQQMAHYEDDGLGQLAVIEKSSGSFIGVAGIIPRMIKEKEEFEMTVSLLPEFWGNGFGTELSLHFLSLGKELNISDRFIAINHEE